MQLCAYLNLFQVLNGRLKQESVLAFFHRRTGQLTLRVLRNPESGAVSSDGDNHKYLKPIENTHTFLFFFLKYPSYIFLVKFY